MKADIDGIEIDYDDEGSGLPVIFIHAFPMNRTMWDEQVAALRGRCRTIRLDLRGFGKSGVPEGPYSMESMASDVRGLMAHLGIESAVLVGLSMGGYISLAFYKLYPDAVRALVLADTRASEDTREGRERRLKAADKAERDGPEAIAKDMELMAFAPSTLENRRDVVERTRVIIEANSPQGIAAAQRGMATRNDSTYVLIGIDCPTLIIVGSEDSLTPPSEAEALRNGIPHSRMRVIEGAGHMSNMEQPEQFNSALIEFLDSLG
ncbi:MAG TPA: alpha/beta fold hydrolase [Blastocatellia bacterium]|nr:alpha/beta fold hydrolase [Blastocatellia bacterium]